MKTWQVVTLARDLFIQHGLIDWTFDFDHAKVRAGCCKYRHKKITLSYHFVEHNSDKEIKETVLHEIAHALAGPGQGHGPIWKAVCRRIGCKPVRCYGREVTMPEGRWKAVCPGCCQEFRRHRRAMRQLHCKKCGPERGTLYFRRIIEWLKKEGVK